MSFSWPQVLAGCAPSPAGIGDSSGSAETPFRTTTPSSVLALRLTGTVLRIEP
jgi:hypothetical protein